MDDADISLQEAAERLGVHYMTAYRYVRLGLLPARKVGAAWRVRSDDLDAFRSGGSQTVSTAPAGGSRRRAPWAERFEARLLAGDGRGAWGVVEAALASGTELDELYLEVIAPAMASIGTRWAAGEVDIATEHRASGIALRIIGRLGPRFVRRGRTRGTVVVGTPAGERHFLPVAMVADLARAAGWEVSDLGADVPADSLAAAAADASRLVAVGLSISTPACLDAAKESCLAVRAAIPTVPIIVGGGAVTGDEHARSLGADAYASDGRSFVTLLETIATGGLRVRHRDDLAG